MNPAQEALGKGLDEADILIKFLKKKTTAQVKSSDEQLSIQGYTIKWFNDLRGIVIEKIPESQLTSIDNLFQDLLKQSQKASTRSKVISTLKSIREDLRRVLSERILELSSPTSPSDSPPDFSKFVQNSKMAEILENRWIECHRCILGLAPLAAIVMMGGLLEAILLSRILGSTAADKKKIFSSQATPIDKYGKTLPLDQWTLKHYIAVVHELGWISIGARDVSIVLRDYRNYIHPQKELTHGVEITNKDAELMWGICKSIILQLI